MVRLYIGWLVFKRVVANHLAMIVEVLTHTISYLDPGSISALSLVSKRFYALISSPHSWRGAFARHFPEQVQLEQPSSPLGLQSGPLQSHDEETRASYSSEKRYFTRLTAQSTWRKEYLLRTALLRSLSRGKANPSQVAPHSQLITYPGCTGGMSVTHTSGTFPPILRTQQPNGTGSVALRPHLMHASCETVTVASSDPTTGRIDRGVIIAGVVQRPSFNWPVPGLADYRPGIELGTSLMDLSDELGWVVGETVPGGRVYVEPKFLIGKQVRGHFLSYVKTAYPTKGEPYISAIWIAKKKANGVFETTNGNCGLLVGDSVGRIIMHSLPTTIKQRNDNNSWVHPVKSWIVSPGIPILSIKVDEEYSARIRRKNKMRNEGMVVVVVNALGEVYYLRDFAGPWRLIEQTKRRVSPYWSALNEEEKKDLETERRMMGLDWLVVKHLWLCWGMDYFVEVDFAGGNVVLGKKASKYVDYTVEDPLVQEEHRKGAWLKCFRLEKRTRHGRETNLDSIVMYLVSPISSSNKAIIPPLAGSDSIFGHGGDYCGTQQGNLRDSCPSESSEDANPRSEETEEVKLGVAPLEGFDVDDVWAVKELSFSYEQRSQKTLEITAWAIDMSRLALLSPDEDKFFSNVDGNGGVHDVPGLNARLYAVGTHTGSIFVWNLRSASHRGPIEQPLRIIHTDSPVITTLGLTSLYLIHGGNDGLVQCWDPLASSLDPIRTIHSRFSSRARRRMAQAEQNHLNIGDNQYAARAVCLDPDPTVLRGVVALGTYVRYWSFSGDVSSQINGKRKKKLVRRAGVGGGVGSPPGRVKTAGDIKGDISAEMRHLAAEREKKYKEEVWLRERFGAVGWGGLSEEEMMAYARMLSEETFEGEQEKEKKQVDVSWAGGSGAMIPPRKEDEEKALEVASMMEKEASSSTSLASSPERSISSTTHSQHGLQDVEAGDDRGEDFDADLAEAIRLSLLDNTPGAGESFRCSYGDGSTNSTGASNSRSASTPVMEPPGPSTSVVVPTPAGSWSRSVGKKGHWGGGRAGTGGGSGSTSAATLDEWPSLEHRR